MTAYTFDVKLFAAITIAANSEEEARRKLRSLFDCGSCIALDARGEPLVTFEASQDEPDNDELVQIDGKDVP